jgi:hypothetical protein
MQYEKTLLFNLDKVKKLTIYQLRSYLHGAQTVLDVSLKVRILNSTPKCFVQVGHNSLQCLKCCALCASQHQFRAQLPQCSIAPHLRT